MISAPYNQDYDFSTYQSITSAETTETVTRIKICGITNGEDARAAVEFGADALGFIFVPGSPRFVSPDAFARLVCAVPPFVSTVIVARRPEDAGDSASNYVQFYEEADDPATEALLCRAPGRYIRAFRMENEAALAEIRGYPHRRAVAAYHLDAYHKDKLGGVGETFNWDLAVEAKRITDKPILLAGGLTPENVGEAVARVRPYAVDVSSGVEAEPGRKDHEKMRAFIRAVRGVL